ncbi:MULTISPECIES: DUF7344 domain-containing protein [Halorussus]|uniref:DUF7344 domain-containing protein n=1 Tax=Halorussus TaxID=1070314 RepID=UPI00209D4DD6|nr:hypothetical protein [Halorussus vallis]USZ76071.1 hypothetical protein NGM07_01805 [Halorussus vallis]
MSQTRYRSTVGGPDESRGSLDTQFDVLRNRRRRYVLRHLRDRTLPVAVADLARVVAADEEGVEPGDASESAVDRAYVSLYHNHVPKMVDAGLLVRFEERNTVALADDAPTVDRFLRSLSALE